MGMQPVVSSNNVRRDRVQKTNPVDVQRVWHISLVGMARIAAVIPVKRSVAPLQRPVQFVLRWKLVCRQPRKPNVVARVYLRVEKERQVTHPAQGDQETQYKKTGQ